MKNKDIFKLTEREKAILALANFKVIMPCNALVGVLKYYGKKYVKSYLLALEDDGKAIALRFDTSMNYYKKKKSFSDREYKEYMGACKNYLESFLHRSILVNSNDEKVYSPSTRLLTIEYPGSWNETTCLYTMPNNKLNKIPNFIEFGWQTDNLENISKDLNASQFDFRYKYESLNDMRTKDISKLKLRDLESGVIMEV
jgi:hypothetical protein